MLVVDTDRGSAVAVIRSLGRAGWNVIAADSRRRSLGFRSRYASERVVYPDPETASGSFVDAIERLVDGGRVDLVIPTTDEVIQPLVHARERLERHCRLAVADSDALERVTDKSRTLALAQELGVPVPPTRVVNSTAEAEEASRSMRWPLVVKPAVSRFYRPGRGVVESFSVTYARDLESLRDRMAPLSGRCAVLLQEYCPGVGEGVELLASEGRVLAAFQHRRLAEVPLTGGRSAWRESVALDAELYAHASRLVEALCWSGLMMVEFRVGEEARLMEINGRIWGSLPLAVRSGIDFPARLAELATCGPPPSDVAPEVDYLLGVRAFNLELTLNWMLRMLFARRRSQPVPIPERRRLLAAALGLLSWRQKLDLTCADDPWPALCEPFRIARKGAGKLWSALAGGRTHGRHV